MTSNSINHSNQNDFVFNPKKFVLWLIIVASVMLFAGFTSAYIVRRGEGNWELFKLPTSFIYSTIVIALSSISMQASVMAAKKGNSKRASAMLWITLGLGLAFCALQYLGWKQLIADNVYFAFSNPSNSFVYVITGVHLAHVIGGLVFLIGIAIQSLKKQQNNGINIYHSMCNTYWHFIGILWIYLYFFLYLNR
jgi:cytochrome c oxidase subunit 3